VSAAKSDAKALPEHQSFDPGKASTTGRSNREIEILQTTKAIFAKHGFRNTDVQEIADAVGVGKGTIYRTFNSKEELFYATVDHCMQRLNEAMQVDECPDYSEIDAQKAAQRLETKFLWFLQFFDANPEVIELLIQERSEFRDRDSHSYTRNWL
jgi:AcrR family transcriptional regulator